MQPPWQVDVSAEIAPQIPDFLSWSHEESRKLQSELGTAGGDGVRPGQGCTLVALKKRCLEILEKDNVAWMIPPDWVALAGVGRAADLIFQQTSTRNSTEALQGCQHSEKVCTRQTSRTTAHVCLAPDFGEVSGDVTFSAQKIAKNNILQSWVVVEN